MHEMHNLLPMYYQPARIVKDARRLLGCTQSQFAEKFCKDQTLISKYESGKVNPPTDLIMQCMHILSSSGARGDGPENVDVEELVRSLRADFSGNERTEERWILLKLMRSLSRAGV